MHGNLCKGETVMVRIPGGTYYIGTDGQEGFESDQEGPRQQVTLPSYDIDATTVTNEEFAHFISETGYQTEAEVFGWSFVFHYFLTEEEKQQSKQVDHLMWWYAVEGACWHSPEGFDSHLGERLDHPVVHVSRNDAVAYCQWAGKRLPTEAEWEVAAKGDRETVLYPWGDELLLSNEHQCNIWQGDFPKINTLEDGYAGTAPVKTYHPNAYGLYQMIGNVWEWCVNPRGIDLSEFNHRSGARFWEDYQKNDDYSYAIKGGSFLCHQSYCKRYRVSARNGNTGQSSSSNTSFRCVKDE